MSGFTNCPETPMNIQTRTAGGKPRDIASLYSLDLVNVVENEAEVRTRLDSVLLGLGKCICLFEGSTYEDELQHLFRLEEVEHRVYSVGADYRSGYWVKGWSTQPLDCSWLPCVFSIDAEGSDWMWAFYGSEKSAEEYLWAYPGSEPSYEDVGPPTRLLDFIEVVGTPDLVLWNPADTAGIGHICVARLIAPASD